MSKVSEAKVADLIPDNLNFNKGTEYGNALLEKSFQKFGAGRSILLDKNNRIIAGNKAAGKYGELGGEKVIVVETDGNTLVAVKRTDVDLDSQAGRELALADNATQRADLEWDTEVIKEAQEKWGLDADAWGVKVEWLPEGEEGDNNYSRKIEVPTYEPNEVCPAISDLTDNAKYEELCKEIEDAKVPADIAQFLRLAASRHIVFNYSKIADYYAHADASVQELFEKSALVIIDFDKAIENGFVSMCKKIADQYNEDYDEE